MNNDMSADVASMLDEDSCFIKPTSMIKDVTSSFTSSNTRKLRTYSYRRAITTPPRINAPSAMSHLPEQNDQENGNSLEKELHYQQIAEMGVKNDEENELEAMMDELEINYGLEHRWSSQTQLQNNSLLQSMSAREKKRQEAMFELIRSESSYLRSLTLLVNHFMKSQELRSCMTNTEFHHLFSNVEAVRSTSKRFFSALERRRKSSSLVIDDVCDIVHDYVTASHFEPYVTYCSNESFQQRALQKLMNLNSNFIQALRKLESKPECSGLPLHSFLLLPMQRITRLPLLVDSIRQQCDVTMTQYHSASVALKETTRLVKICNERAKSLERTEQMVQLQQQLEFKSARSFALISSSRYLMKRGPLVRITEEVVLGFKRIQKQEIYLFLFSDVILLARKKNNDLYSVTDFCYRDRLRSRDVINDDLTFIVIMERNQDGEEVELCLEADCPNTKARWMTAIKTTQTPEHKITKRTMQVEIVRSLLTNEPDMLSLKVMDVYIVLTSSCDGWIYGERLSDGCRAWFPSTHSKEILSEQIRERNLQRRNRMLGEETVV